MADLIQKYELKVCIITQKDSSAVIRFLLKLRGFVWVGFFYTVPRFYSPGSVQILCGRPEGTLPR